MTEAAYRKVLERAQALTARFLDQAPPSDIAQDVRVLAHMAYTVVPNIEDERERVKALIGLFYTAYLMGAEQGPERAITPEMKADVQLFLDALDGGTPPSVEAKEA